MSGGISTFEDFKNMSKPASKREKNQEIILAAAEEEFVKNGFKGTSMQAISDTAGLPKANIHYYFNNKAKLYNTVLQDIIAQWNAVLSDVKKEDDPTQVLEKYIKVKVELAFTKTNASKIFATEIIQGAPNLIDYVKKDMRKWMRKKEEIIEYWIEQGLMTPVNPQALIFLIWSSTQHYADFETQILGITNKAEYEEKDINNTYRFLCHMILTGCGLTPSQPLH